MKDRAPHLDTLLELETRHEDLLHLLDELDRQVDRILAECQGGRNPAKKPSQPALRDSDGLSARQQPI